MEQAIDLLFEYQNRDYKEWSDCLHNSNIKDKYETWAYELRHRLEWERHKIFRAITVKEFCDALIIADWKKEDDSWTYANNPSALVRYHLMYADPSPKPEIYLGSSETSSFAVRVNGQCLHPAEAGCVALNFYGPSNIYDDCLFAMRYEPLGPVQSPQTLMFIPIGKSTGPLLLTTTRSVLSVLT